MTAESLAYNFGRSPPGRSPDGARRSPGSGTPPAADASRRPGQGAFAYGSLFQPDPLTALTDPPAADVRAAALAGVRAAGAAAAKYVEGGPGDVALVVQVETVDAGAAGVVCRVHAAARRPALVTAPGWAGQTAAGVWDRSRIGITPPRLAPSALLGIVRELTAAFATDWRAANPG